MPQGLPEAEGQRKRPEEALLQDQPEPLHLLTCDQEKTGDVCGVSTDYPSCHRGVRPPPDCRPRGGPSCNGGQRDNDLLEEIDLALLDDETVAALYEDLQVPDEKEEEPDFGPGQ